MFGSGARSARDSIHGEGYRHPAPNPSAQLTGADPAGATATRAPTSFRRCFFNPATSPTGFRRDFFRSDFFGRHFFFRGNFFRSDFDATRFFFDGRFRPRRFGGGRRGGS